MQTKIGRRNFLKKMGLGVAALAMPKLTHGANRARKPNLLFVFADQFRRQAMGFMNADSAITPNFDNFAKEAMVFTNAISSFPLCSPFRATLMTGRFALSTAITTNCQPGLNLELRADEVCIGDVLKANGYSTGYVGKWHLETPSRNSAKNPPDEPVYSWDGWTPPGPRRHGFDFWCAYNTNNAHFTPNYWKDSPKRIEAKQWSVEHETDVAIDFVKSRKKDEPFALFVSWNPPHPPYVAPEKYKSMYKAEELPIRPNVKLPNKKFEKSHMPYCAAVSSCDDNFGRLLKMLAECGIADDTIVVFTADHGEMMASHGRFGKSIWYEESIGIPFMVRWPRHIKPGRDDMPFASYHFMPTLLGLMGLPIPKTVEGTDYSKLMLGEHVPKPSAAFIGCYQYPDNVLAVGQEPSRWVQQGVNLRKKGIDWRTVGFRGLRTRRYTYVVDRGTDGPNGPYSAEEIAKAIAEGRIMKRLLYDNGKDPYQLNPIQAVRADENPIMAKFDKQLQQWLEKMRDPFPLT